MVALLDANVLVALFDPEHTHHTVAKGAGPEHVQRLGRERSDTWFAACHPMERPASLPAV